MDGAAADENRPATTATAAKDEPQPTVRSALVEEAARVATTLNEKLPPLSKETSASGNHTETSASGNYKAAPESAREPHAREDATVSGAQASQSFGREESVAEPAAATAAAQVETHGRIGRRATAVGASVGENLRPRVEKLREASTVVFDEATDDPGLRFVIVAAVLFILFLFILLFSYILG
ncbi:MAG TPA: hypothetical protein VGA87_10305 [Pyrinomonadaceae bacterium]